MDWGLAYTAFLPDIPAVFGIQTNRKLDQILKLMSNISDEIAAVAANLASVQTTLNNIVSGISALDALITQLETTAGDSLTPATQAALDAVSNASTALVAQANAVSTEPPTPPAK